MPASSHAFLDINPRRAAHLSAPSKKNSASPSSGGVAAAMARAWPTPSGGKGLDTQDFTVVPHEAARRPEVPHVHVHAQEQRRGGRVPRRRPPARRRSALEPDFAAL